MYSILLLSVKKPLLFFPIMPQLVVGNKGDVCNLLS